MDTKTTIIILLGALGVAAARAVLADTVNVANHISASAITGGNSGASVSNGTATVNVHIERTVNGAADPPIDITTSSPSGHASVSVKSDFRASTTITEATGTAGIVINTKPEGTTGTRTFAWHFRSFFDAWFGSLFKFFRL